LSKTGLTTALNTTGAAGKTLFAPTNFAFLKLGPKINAFLFSKFGEKYLKALLEYHISPDTTLYSTTIYTPKEKEGVALFSEPEEHKCHKKEGKQGGLLHRLKSMITSDHKGKKHSSFSHVHVDLPTLLKGKSIAVDLFRTGPFVHVKLNAVVPVVAADGIAADGVLHAITRVLIPPKSPKGESVQVWEDWVEEDEAEEMSFEEFLERLEPFVAKEHRVLQDKFDLSGNLEF
jgi:uncharacterized surface protein with fasciclin (FAS1) repeats